MHRSTGSRYMGKRNSDSVLDNLIKLGNNLNIGEDSGHAGLRLGEMERGEYFDQIHFTFSDVIKSLIPNNFSFDW